MTNESSSSSDADNLDAANRDAYPDGRDTDPFESDCSAMIARLHVFLDGELTDDRRTRIQAHLDDCPSCFGAFDFEAELRTVVRSRVQARVPPALIERIRLAICTPPSVTGPAS